jgi:hypothetical protein
MNYRYAEMFLDKFNQAELLRESESEGHFKDYTPYERKVFLAVVFAAHYVEPPALTLDDKDINAKMKILAFLLKELDTSLKESYELIKLNLEWLFEDVREFDKEKRNTIVFYTCCMLLCDGKLNDYEVDFLKKFIKVAKLSNKDLQDLSIRLKDNDFIT